MFVTFDVTFWVYSPALGAIIVRGFVTRARSVEDAISNTAALLGIGEEIDALEVRLA
jgi:hypothetical protein